MNKLSLLSGNPYEVNQYITINHPTLRQVTSYGEQEYLGLVSCLTATSYDYRFMLDDMGEYYEDVDDYTMFCRVAPNLTLEETAILFGDLNFQNFVPVIKNKTEIILRDEENDINIDPVIYELIVAYLRTLHGLERNYKTPGNRMAAKFYLEDERREFEERSKHFNAEIESTYEPLILSLVNCADFKYDYETVWDLPLYTFMASAKQINKLVNYKNVMTGVYTGNIDIKKIKDKKSLTWIGE